MQNRRAMDTDAFLAATLRNPINEAIADGLFRLALPDAWIVSAAWYRRRGMC
jgi:uncharacterized protein